jgi:hypothetical protein
VRRAATDKEAMELASTLFRCDQDLGDFLQFLLTRISLWLYTQFRNVSVEEQKGW